MTMVERQDSLAPARGEALASAIENATWELAEAVAATRGRLGLSLRQVARATRLTHTTIRYVELGRLADLPTLCALLRWLEDVA